MNDSSNLNKSFVIIKKYTELAFKVQVQGPLLSVNCYKEYEGKVYRKYILSSFLQNIPSHLAFLYDLKSQGLILKQSPFQIKLSSYEPHLQVKKLLQKQFDQLLCLKIGLNTRSKLQYQKILLQRTKKQDKSKNILIKQTIKYYYISKNQVKQGQAVKNKLKNSSFYQNSLQKSYINNSSKYSSFYSNQSSFQIQNQQPQDQSITINQINKNSQFTLTIFFHNSNKTVIDSITKRLENIRKQVVLYSLDDFIYRLPVNFIYFQQIFVKIVQKYTNQLKNVIQSKSQFQLWGQGISSYKKSLNKNNYDLLQGNYFISIKVLGDLTKLNKLYTQIDNFFYSNQIMIITVESISCCILRQVQNYIQKNKKQKIILIGSSIIGVLLKKKRFIKQNSVLQKYIYQTTKQKSFKQKIKRYLQTGEFIIQLDSTFRDPQQDQYRSQQSDNQDFSQGMLRLKNQKIRQDFKQYLFDTCQAQFEYGQYLGNSLTLICDRQTAKLFQNKCKNFLADMKIQVQKIQYFKTQFEMYLFQKFLKQKFVKAYAGTKFTTKINKKTNIKQLYRQNYAKYSQTINAQLNVQKRDISKLIVHEITTCSNIEKKNWFNVVSQPNSLLIQNLTCVKYSMIDKAKIYILPFQSITSHISEMIFFIDQNFKECWQFYQICKQNKIDMKVLQIQFTGKKKKNPEHLRQFLLNKTKYLNNMIVWFNDMQKRNTTHRDNQITDMMNLYSKNARLDIVLPRHAYRILIQYIFPFFFQALLKQSGLRIKQIYIYYSNSPQMIMNRQPGERTIEDLIIKTIHQKFRQFQGRIQKINDLYLTYDNIRKILALKYVSLYYYGNASLNRLKKYRASTMNSFSKKCKNSNFSSQTRHKIPIFFQCQNFQYEILVDVNQNTYFQIDKKEVKKPRFIQSHTQLYKSLLLLKQIFKKSTYFVLYRSENWNIKLEGYFWSNSQQSISQQNSFDYKLSLKHMKISLQSKQIRLNQKTDMPNEIICQIQQSYIQNFSIIQAHVQDSIQLKNQITQWQWQQNELQNIQESEIYIDQNQTAGSKLNQSILKNI